MSKFKVINGANVISIAQRDREVRALQAAIAKKAVLKPKETFVYAYHFTRLEHPILAQKYLNLIPSSYFQGGIYKDLFQALLGWSIIKATPGVKNPKLDRAYEFYIVVRRSLESFSQLNFEARPAFLNFKYELAKLSNFTSDPQN